MLGVAYFRIVSTSRHEKVKLLDKWKCQDMQVHNYRVGMPVAEELDFFVINSPQRRAMAPPGHMARAMMSLGKSPSFGPVQWVARRRVAVI